MGVVLERLPEGDAKGEDEQRERDPDRPAAQLFASAAASAVPTLDRAERRHGE